MIQKKKIMNKKYTPEEIDIAIYGDGGLYDRVAAEMRKEPIRDISKKIKYSVQRIYIFLGAKCADGHYKHRPKFDTIMDYANKLGVK